MIRTCLALAMALLPFPALACRLALAFALDVSGSVDQREYRQQLDGLAEALLDKDVQAALFSIPDAPVALAAYEWSAQTYQRMLHPWMLIDSPEALETFTAGLKQRQRKPAPETTGLGAAMLYGRDLFKSNPGCDQETLDISGDGENNDWPIPRDLRRNGELGFMRINALAITTGAAGARPGQADNLVEYFRADIIHGPGAFVEMAQGFDDYAQAMRRKLLRELQTLPVGNLPLEPNRSQRLAARRLDQ